MPRCRATSRSTPPSPPPTTSTAFGSFCSSRMHIRINKGDISFYAVVGPTLHPHHTWLILPIMHMKHYSIAWGYASCAQLMQRTVQLTGDAPATGQHADLNTSMLAQRNAAALTLPSLCRCDPGLESALSGENMHDTTMFVHGACTMPVSITAAFGAYGRHARKARDVWTLANPCCMMHLRT